VEHAPILVVEDDPDSRVMLTTALELDGHEVVAAANGAEAFQLARRHHPCLIILDLMMPVMNGEAFRRAQLDDPELRDIPVLVLSAHPNASHLAREMHAIDAIAKPCDFDRLVAHVTERCGSR
jgi:CheY-like chemotaxis protein